MTLLAPAALFGLFLLALPILVHLFKPRKMKVTPFSSLRWLQLTQQRLSRRIQWHQWLLFLARAGLLTLLVLALARPLVGALGTGGAVDRIIVLDAGQSMAYRAPKLLTPWENAQTLVQQLLAEPRVGERSAVVVVDHRARLLVPLSADATAVLPQLQDLQPSLADTDLGSCFPLVEAMLAEPDATSRQTELVVITDNQQHAWKQRDIHALTARLKQPLRVQVVDVGLGKPSNAWIVGAKLLGTDPKQQRFLGVEVGACGTKQLPRSLKLTGVAGLTDDVQPLTPQVGRVSRAVFRLPAGIDLEGQSARLVLEPVDNLASDDTFNLPLGSGTGHRVLLITPQAAGPDGRAVDVFLRSGLEALSAAQPGLLTLTSRSPETTTVDDVHRADVLLLASAAELHPTVLERVEARVRAGAGLIVWLGPRFNPAFYNDRLYRVLQPAEGLSPLKLAATPLSRPPQPSALVKARWSHPVLFGLNDPVLGDWSRGLFTHYARLEGELGKLDQVLARYEDDTPAIVERALGAGRIVLLNTSANDEWSDLPRRQSFVPLLDRLLSYLSPGAESRVFTVGSAVTLPLPETVEPQTVEITTPAGKTIAPRLLVQAGKKLLFVEEVSEAGLYRTTVAGVPAISLNFTVNAGRASSHLAPTDVQALKESWAPVSVEFLSGTEAAQRWQTLGYDWPLWPALLVLGLLLLAVETVYAAWLSPGKQPTLIGSVIHGRGMFRPAAAGAPPTVDR